MTNTKSWTTVNATSIKSSTPKDDAPPIYGVFTDQNGETVFVSGQKIGRGGEADVYRYRSDKVAKLFRTEDPEKEKKLKLLLQLVNLDNAFCLPERLLYNKNGKLAGYIMSYRSGFILAESIFQAKEFSNRFPGWTRIELTTLALRCLEAIENLHKYDILIGDMNASNIIVESPGNVSFIDVDSYQIGELRCKVGTVSPFTSPRLHGKSFKSEPRTIEDEQFATATLLFMIFHLGKLPFSNQGGNIGENIINRNFAFPISPEEIISFSKRSVWGRIWEALPSNIRNAFYRTFKQGDSVGYLEWRELLRRYLSDLERNKFSRVILPQII